MDFFERAHVVKIDRERKEKKSEVNMKKQLKQMLQGYKCNDNKIIKEAGNKNEFDDFVGHLDDSTSVSGFSDLNLTNSSAEGDKILILPTNINASLEISNETKPNNSVTNDELKQSMQVDSDSLSDKKEDENIQSLTEYTHTPNSVSNESETLMFSDTEASKSSEYSSSGSEFDKDGVLASKILTRLHSKGPEQRKKKHRELKHMVVEDNNIEDVLGDSIDSNNDMKKSDSESLCFSQDSSIVSSPYVSIIAEDLPDQSLNEIIGDYRYSTVKNLPSDKQNVIKSSLSSGRNLELSDIQAEEEVDSLIPEIGEEPSIEELEITNIDDSSHQHIDDSTIVIDDSRIAISDAILTEESSSIQDIEPNHLKSFKVYHGKHMCIFIMKHPSKIYINGKMKIKALGGTVEVFGYTLKDRFCNLYAPNYNCAQCITTVEAQNVYYGLFGKLTSSGLSIQDAEDIVTTLGEYDAVLCLSALNRRAIDFVENNITIDLFSKQIKNIERCFKNASDIVGCTFYSVPPIKYYEVNPSWQEVIDSANDNKSRTIVCGGKGSGKSTFVRYFVNKLLARGSVLVIDLDPGQAEFTVAGHVSATVVTEPLLGPNFTHLSSPDFMLNVGAINIMDNPFRYINAILELIAHCHCNSRYETMPWIVNTMGMSNNLGLKFITAIIMSVQPTFVLQFDHKHPKKRFEVDLHPVMVKSLLNNFHQDRLFKNVTQNILTELSYKFLLCNNNTDGSMSSKRLIPREERYLNYLAYFGELLDSHSGSKLLDIVPYQVKLCNFNVASNVKIPEESVAKVINGKIIALCQLATKDKGKVFVLRDYAIRCLGHGLVRGVDFENGVLYVITPAPVHILNLVNTFVYCDWVPELRGEERNLPKGTVVPYRAISVSKQKRLMSAPRRRYNPLQLLKMSRNA